jgi:hypothetical protein
VLKSIDILLGLSVVMLMVSLVVTVLTQAIMNVMQTRGKNLRDGISGLLRQIHGPLSIKVSVEIAEKLLTHPLIKSAGSGFGTVIHREELTALLLELAAGDGPHQLEAAAQTELCNLLKANGIDDPKRTMDNVRALTLQLEQAFPSLSNNERYSTAFLQEAQSRFLGKVNGWFDQTIDRVSDRFTNSARLVTFFGSLAVALVLQLDTTALVNRLSTDPAFRQALVEQALKTANTEVALQPPPTNNNQAAYLVPTLSSKDRQNLQSLATFDVIEIPASGKQWRDNWTAENWFMKLLGIVLTAMLLSLGAPFWYNALKNLIRLRSLIAQKDDDQRLSRQTDTAPPATATASSPGLSIAGERGDLASVG